MIKSKKDLYAGLMFIAFGIGFAWVAGNYPMGSAVRMGPAYFPTILGWLLASLGLIILIRGVTVPDVAPTRTQWNTLFWILGSVVLFGWLVEWLKMGFVPAVFATVLFCAYGGYEFRWKESIIEAVVLVVVCWAAFVWGLGLPFRLFPWDH
jgi:hypothetical protein